MMTYQNIKLNDVRSLDAKLLNDEYYDFMLYKGSAYGASNPSDLSVAEFSCPFDIEDGILYSTTTWQDAINEGVELDDIGFTGIDNGLLRFQKDRISNKDFLEVLTGSTYSIEEDDKRLFLTPITGNTLHFDYPMSLENDETGCFVSLRGGFYQGFYKLYGFDYQTLPNGVDVEWNLNFSIRPRSDYEIEPTTVNHIHPENKGIFFYMGARAENKFWDFYNTSSAITESLKRESIRTDGYLDPSACGESGDVLTFRTSANDLTEYMNVEPEDIPESYFGDDYTISASTKDCPCAQSGIEKEKKKNSYSVDDYFANREYMEDSCTFVLKAIEKCLPEKINKACGCDEQSFDFHISDFYDYKYRETSNCCVSEPSRPCKCKGGDYKAPCECDEYFQDSYFEEKCGKGDKAIDTDYMEKDIEINEAELSDTFGHELLKKGYYEIESDNKFLMFDRTKEGFTVNTWVEGTKVTLTGRQDWKNINYFPLMNRTATGYTIDTISQYQEENSLEYNIYKDIQNNAFALRITDAGAIGYRYGIKDCEEEETHYSVVEEYSKDGIVKFDEWNTINVKIAIINPSLTKCDPHKGKRRMKLYFYVNGYLVFISKELPEFNFHELNDTKQKQETVPFNISLGGGTLGLLESVLPDYYYSSDYIFPLEKDFCGTFLGDIKCFRFYNGVLNYLTIRNYLSENKI